MLSNLIFSLNHTAPLFALMVLGYILRRRGFLSEEFVSGANKLVFHVSLPVLLFSDLSGTDIRACFDAGYVWYCAAVTLASILVTWFLARHLIKDKTLIGEFVQGSYRSSAAILGVALVMLIYDKADMSGLMILGCVPLYNIFAVLILVLECPARYEEGKASQPLGPLLRRTLYKIATNPIIIGLVLGFLWSLLRLPLPEAAQDTLSMLGNISSPIALIAIGAGFKGTEAISEGKLTAVATLIKLVILPALFLPLAVHFGFTGEKLVGILVMLGSITTPASYVMARQMGHKGTLTASICVATTIFMPLTLTFWLFLMESMHWI